MSARRRTRVAGSYVDEGHVSSGPVVRSQARWGKPRQSEVYLVRFEGVGGFTFHKVGVTSYRVAGRFGEAPNGYDYKQLRRFIFSDRDAALRMEEKILRALRPRRPYAGLSGLGPLPSGNSEVIVAREDEILRTVDRIAAGVPGWSSGRLTLEPPRRRTGPSVPPKVWLLVLAALAVAFVVTGDQAEYGEPNPPTTVESASTPQTKAPPPEITLPQPEVSAPRLPPPAYSPRSGVVVPPVGN